MNSGPATSVEIPSAGAPSNLSYELEDSPPLSVSIIVALQHVLAVFIGIITPPLLISRELSLADSDGRLLISMALVSSGIGTLLQTRRLGPVGSGLLNVQGTSFVFLAPVVSLASEVAASGGTKAQGLGTVFGVCLASSLVPILCSPFLRLLSRVITPLVTGIVVMLIGLSLMGVAITSVGGGFDARRDGTFGAAANLGLAMLVITLIVALNASSRAWVRTLSIVAGVTAGYLVGLRAGKVTWSALGALPWFSVPTPLHFGLGFHASALIPFGFLYLITAIESIGDVTATSSISGQPITGPLYLRRLRGAILADGVSSMLGALLNSSPTTTFAQNNAVIQLTGVASRRIGVLVGALLVALGMLPRMSAVVQAMPQSVLGGATLIMFGTVAVAGLRILAGIGLDRRSSTIAAVSLALGLGVAFVPDVTAGLPPLARDIFGSGIATGGLCALVLNGVLPGRNGR